MVQPGTIDYRDQTLYRIGGMNPAGFYSQDQLNNNMSGNDANAIYYATHDQRFNPNSPFTAERNQMLAGDGYKQDVGNQEVYDGYNAYVTGAGASMYPYRDEALEMGVGSSGGIPEELLINSLNPSHSAYAAAVKDLLYAKKNLGADLPYSILGLFGNGV